MTQRILIVLNIIFWSIFLFNKLGDNATPEPVPKENHQTYQQEQTLKTPDLNITFLDFADRYNSLLIKLNIPKYGLNNLYWDKKSDKKTFFCDLSNTVIIFGNVDSKTEKLLDITVGCEPNKTHNKEKTVATSALLHALIMKSLNPSLSKAKLDLIGEHLKRNLKHGSIVDGDVKYQSTVYNQKLLLSVVPNGL